MRNTTVAGTLAFIGLMTGAQATPLPAQQVQVSSANRTIAVTATDSVERRADTAAIHIGYQLYGPTSEQVNQDAGKTSAAIIESVTKTGIDKQAIQSENQSTGPVEGYQDSGLTPDERTNHRFQAQQSWAVRTNVQDAAKVLAAAISAGANQSGSIDWTVADEESLSAAAAAKALQHARQIATQMAAGLGVKVGALLYASNEAEQLRIMPMMARENGILGGMGSGAGTGVRPLNLSPPIVSRSATVSAIFTIQ